VVNNKEAAARFLSGLPSMQDPADSLTMLLDHQCAEIARDAAQGHIEFVSDDVLMMELGGRFNQGFVCAGRKIIEEGKPFTRRLLGGDPVVCAGLAAFLESESINHFRRTGVRASSEESLGEPQDD